jgi:hypothetical protein
MFRLSGASVWSAARRTTAEPFSWIGNLRQSLDTYTTTGWGLCLEHQKLHDDGFVAFVECDPEKSGSPSSGDRLKLGDAFRTGRVVHLKREYFSALFNAEIQPNLPMVFVEPAFSRN